MAQIWAMLGQKNLVTLLWFWWCTFYVPVPHTLLFQICSWVQDHGGWSAVLHSGLNVMQQTAVIGTCVAVFVCCMIYIRKNWWNHISFIRSLFNYYPFFIRYFSCYYYLIFAANKWSLSPLEKGVVCDDDAMMIEMHLISQKSWVFA